MNLKLNLPQEKMEVFFLFFGAVLIASVLSGAVFYLMQHKFPPHGVPLPIWLAAFFWLFALFMVPQIQNTLLRIAILSWVISKILLWQFIGHEGLAAWLACKGFLLLAGVLMVVVGIRRCRKGACIGAFLLMVALSVVQYVTVVNWARDLEEINRHKMYRVMQNPTE
jgi:hypothetical protein